MLCLNTRWSCCGWRSRLSGRSASVWTGTWRPTWPPSPTPWRQTWPTAPTAASPRAGPLKVGLYCHLVILRERVDIWKYLKIFAIPWTLNEYYLSCRRHIVSCLRPYLKGGSGILVLFSLSFPDILHSLRDCILFLNCQHYTKNYDKN